MKLSEDKQSIRVNDSLTLTGIPPGVRLVGQVVRVSVETVRIVKTLPRAF